MRLMLEEGARSRGPSPVTGALSMHTKIKGPGRLGRWCWCSVQRPRRCTSVVHVNVDDSCVSPRPRARPSPLTSGHRSQFYNYVDHTEMPQGRSPVVDCMRNDVVSWLPSGLCHC